MTNSNFTSQLKKFKELHPDAIFLMRKEDAYEIYNEDARKAAPVLGFTPQPAIGGLDYVLRFPVHHLDIALPRLVRAGFRIAIVEHPEDWQQ